MIDFVFYCVLMGCFIAVYVVARLVLRSHDQEEEDRKSAALRQQRAKVYREDFAPFVRWAKELGVRVICPASSDETLEYHFYSDYKDTYMWDSNEEGARERNIEALKRSLEPVLSRGDLIVVQASCNRPIREIGVAAHIPSSKVHLFKAAYFIAATRGMCELPAWPYCPRPKLAIGVLAALALMVDPSLDATWMRRRVIEPWMKHVRTSQWSDQQQKITVEP